MIERKQNDSSEPAGVRGARPWLRLPPETYAVVEPLHERISDEIVHTIGREIPSYTRPFEGEFGEVVRTGVDQALRQFAEMIGTGGSIPEHGRRLYIALGRGELRAGRSIGALLAAYRIGAQVAWRHLGEAGLAAGLAPETLNLLAESVFAYIDELSADSAEGYAIEQAARGRRARSAPGGTDRAAAARRSAGRPEIACGGGRRSRLAAARTGRRGRLARISGPRSGRPSATWIDRSAVRRLVQSACARPVRPRASRRACSIAALASVRRRYRGGSRSRGAVVSIRIARA